MSHESDDSVIQLMTHDSLSQDLRGIESGLVSQRVNEASSQNSKLVGWLADSDH